MCEPDGDDEEDLYKYDDDDDDCHTRYCGDFHNFQCENNRYLTSCS